MDNLWINSPIVYGVHVNPQTGCAHYHSPLDILAILFKCCGRYYACYFCHVELADHEARRWQPHEFDTKAILCGACKKEMTIQQYITCASRCVHCNAACNPGCQKHWYLYFS